MGDKLQYYRSRSKEVKKFFGGGGAWTWNRHPSANVVHLFRDHFHVGSFEPKILALLYESDNKPVWEWCWEFPSLIDRRLYPEGLDSLTTRWSENWLERISVSMRTLRSFWFSYLVDKSNEVIHVVLLQTPVKLHPEISSRDSNSNSDGEDRDDEIEEI